MESKLKQISPLENELANELPPRRARQFKYSRGCAREALSSLFQISPLEIPLIAYPGKPPELKDGYGFISFSHCKDALLIGWAERRIGVDIESRKRSFAAKQISNRYFMNEEKDHLKNLNDEEFRSAVLEQWVIKEAAIKWQRGNIANDLSEWIFSNNSHIATHKSLGHKVNFSQINHSYWRLAVASDYKKSCMKPMLCTVLGE